MFLQKDVCASAEFGCEWMSCADGGDGGGLQAFPLARPAASRLSSHLLLGSAENVERRCESNVMNRSDCCVYL